MEKTIAFRISASDYEAFMSKARRQATNVPELLRRLVRGWTAGGIETPGEEKETSDG